MVACNDIYEYVKNLDMFGVTLVFSYNSKSSYKTIFGSTLTLILFVLLIYKLILALKNLILKEKLDIQLTEIPGIDDVIEFQDTEFAVCPLINLYLNNTTYDHIFDVSYIYKNDRNESLRMGPLSNNNCTRKIKFDENLIVPTQEYCHCIKFDNQTHFNVTKNSRILSDMHLSINVKGYFGSVDSSIFEDNLLNIILRTVILLYQNNYVDTSDYYNLIRKYDTGIFDVMNFGTYSNVDLALDKVQIDIFNSIYTFGLVEPDVSSNYSYLINRKENQIVSLQNFGLYSELNYKVKHNDIIKIYSVNTFNLETFIALFGGYFQVFYILFSLTSTLVNFKLFEITLENKLKNRIMKVDKIIKEIDEHMYLSTKNFNKPKLIEVESHIDHHKLQELKVDNKKYDSAGSLNILKPETFIENCNQPGNDILFNNFHNPSPSVSENTIKVKNYLSIVPPLEKKRNSNMNLSYNKEMKDDFIAQLDFEKFYKLVKEIKLIKFFLIDIESLKWINKLSKFPINIKKFETFILDNQSEVDSKNGGKLIKLQKKLKLVKEFLLISIPK